jgi:WD40 repeat protein/tRNA A-37 threonylcarbamoyl transferase component Bud32
VPATDSTTPSVVAVDQPAPPVGRERRSHSMLPTLGPVVPGYEILDELGHGGMGIVYKARQVGLNRIVALKTILTSGRDGSKALERFRREAEVLAQIHHPHIVQIYEVGEADGQPFFSLEFVAGGSLASKLDGTPWAARPAAQLLVKLADAMAAAHQKGIVHRDLKPANILLSTKAEGPSTKPESAGASSLVPGPAYVPMISDFGLAKRLDEGSGQTQIGEILGTPSYMAPEQAAGRTKEIGAVTDIHALGAILYELLTGRPPFRGETSFDTVILVAQQEPVPPRILQPKVPRDLETICLKCLHKAPAQRYASARELAADLERFLDGQPIAARPVGLLERSVNHLRRQPAVAGLAALVVGVSLLAVVLGATQQPTWALAILVLPIATAAVVQGVWHQRQVRALLQRADEQHEQADAARREVEAQVRKTAEALAVAESNLYLLQIAQVERELFAANTERAVELLTACPAMRRRWEWHYLKRLCHAVCDNFHGHGRPPLAVAYRPDGRQLASAGWGNCILLLEDGQVGGPGRSLDGHRAQITGLAYSPAGRHLASASADETVVIWDVASGRSVQILRHPLSVLGVAYSPDGLQLASAGADLIARLWNAQTGQLSRQLRGHAGPVHGVTFSPDSRTLASVGGDGAIKLWDTYSGQELATLRGHSGVVYGVAFRPDGSQLASVGDDRTVRLWDVSSGQLQSTRLRHGGPVVAVAFQPQGDRLASASWDQTIKVWNTAQEHEIATLRGHTGIVTSLAYRPDGQQLASTSQDLTVKLWDVEAAAEARSLRGHHCRVLCLAFTPDGRQLLSGGGRLQANIPGEVCRWDAIAGQELSALSAPIRAALTIAARPDGHQFAAGLEDGSVCYWDPEGSRPQRSVTTHAMAVTAVAYAPDSAFLASGGADGLVKVMHSDNGQELFRVSAELPVTSLAYSPDGRRLAVAGKDRVAQQGDLTVWDVGGKGKVWSHQPVPLITSLAYSRDGNYLLSGHHDGSLRVWHAAQGREMATLRGHTSTVASVAFSPDGDRLVSASHDRTVKLWDIDACEVVLTLTGHTGEVTGVAFAPDGYRLASCSFDQTVRLWSAVPSGLSEQPIASQHSGTDAPGESNRVRDVPAVVPASKRVLPDMSGFDSMS